MGAGGVAEGRGGRVPSGGAERSAAPSEGARPPRGAAEGEKMERSGVFFPLGGAGAQREKTKRSGVFFPLRGAGGSARWPWSGAEHEGGAQRRLDAERSGTATAQRGTGVRDGAERSMKAERSGDLMRSAAEERAPGPRWRSGVEERGRSDRARAAQCGRGDHSPERREASMPPPPPRA